MARKRNNFDPIIFNPLQKVRVVRIFGRGRSWKPESIGYVAHTHIRADTFKQNVVIAFLRFGKSGKPRCDIISVNHPALTLRSTVKGSDKECAEDRIVNNNPRRVDTELEPQLSDTKNLLNFSDIDFTVYLAAFSAYIAHLQNDLKKRSPRERVPQRRIGPGSAVEHLEYMERTGSDRAHFFETTILYTVLSILSTIGKTGDQDYFKRALDFFSDKQIRTAYLEHLHIALCNLRDLVAQYHKKVVADRDRTLFRAEDALAYHKKNY